MTYERFPLIDVQSRNGNYLLVHMFCYPCVTQWPREAASGVARRRCLRLATSNWLRTTDASPLLPGGYVPPPRTTRAFRDQPVGRKIAGSPSVSHSAGLQVTGCPATHERIQSLIPDMSSCERGSLAGDVGFYGANGVTPATSGWTSGRQATSGRPWQAALYRGLPCSRDGTRLTIVELPIAVELRLGLPVAAAICACQAPLDTLEDHTLSCNRGVEQLRRQLRRNESFHTGLVERRGFPAILEPTGLAARH